MNAYTYWFKTNETAPTEYIYVIALTENQAKYFWKNYLKNVLGFASDYTLTPVECIKGKDFIIKHKIGDILGQYAVI